MPTRPLSHSGQPSRYRCTSREPRNRRAYRGGRTEDGCHVQVPHRMLRNPRSSKVPTNAAKDAEVLSRSAGGVVRDVVAGARRQVRLMSSTFCAQAGVRAHGPPLAAVALWVRTSHHGCACSAVRASTSAWRCRSTRAVSGLPGLTGRKLRLRTVAAGPRRSCEAAARSRNSGRERIPRASWWRSGPWRPSAARPAARGDRGGVAHR